jgi:hypothetical protein
MIEPIFPTTWFTHIKYYFCKQIFNFERDERK